MMAVGAAVRVTYRFSSSSRHGFKATLFVGVVGETFLTSDGVPQCLLISLLAVQLQSSLAETGMTAVGAAIHVFCHRFPFTRDVESPSSVNVVEEAFLDPDDVL